MTNTWTLNMDGSVDFNGDVHFPAGTDLASGVGVMIFGPGGGMASFPAIDTGPSGLPPVIDSCSATALAYTASPTVTPTLVSPGSNGVAAHYTLAFGIPVGTPGVAGSFTMASATDLSGTATVKYIPVVTGTGPTAFTYEPQLVGDEYTAAVSTVTSVTGNQTLCSLTIPAQPFNWRPVIWADATVTGAASGVQIDLAAMLSTTSGTVVGYGHGNPGVGPATTILLPNGVGASVSASQVNASSSQIILLRSLQIDSTGSAYTINGSRSSFTVKVCPIP